MSTKLVMLAGGRPEAVTLARSGAADGLGIRGQAVLFSETAQLHPGFMISMVPESLVGSYDDVVLNAYEHKSAPFARTKAGDLRLSLGEKSFDFEADVDVDDTGFRDLHGRVKRGVVDGASLGMILSKSRFEVDQQTGDVRQVVLDVKRTFEVTLVSDPVFRKTTARSMRREVEFSRGEFAGVPEDVLAERERVLSKKSARPPDFSKRLAARRAEILSLEG